MGRPKLTITYATIAQLWDDPLFWEYAVDWETDRETAEELLYKNKFPASIIKLKNTELMKSWIKQLVQNPDKPSKKVDQIINYIRKCRKRDNEEIYVKQLSGTTIKLHRYT